MFKKIKNYILGFIYKKSIVSVQVIDKDTQLNSSKFKTIRTLNVATQVGYVRFVFKEDTFVDKDLYYKVFFVCTELDESIKAIRQDIVNKGIVVIKLAMIKPNYEVLTNVLLDVYLKTMDGYKDFTIE